MFEPYIDSAKEAAHYLENYLKVALKVKEIVRKEWKDARIYIFGSVIEGKATAASDIDILIACSNVTYDDSLRMKAKIRREIGFAAPIQLHIVDEKGLNWYLRFINKLKEI